MSEPTAKAEITVQEGGVLASLPRTRPQRQSRRRQSARATNLDAGVNAGATRSADSTRSPSSTRSAKKPATKPRRAKRTAAARAAEPPVPPQGFEPENDVSDPVSPPSGAELLASLGGVAGELVQSSLSAGGRLLRDALSRF
jgi:hypothetical protein